MRFVSIGAVVAAGVACVGPGSALQPDAVKTEARYLGHDDGVQPPSRVPTKRIFIVVENRLPAGNVIGEDNGTHVPIHGEPEALAKMVERGFHTEFARFGIHVSESQQASDVVLRVALTEVKVVENMTYYATLLTSVDVTDPSGNALGRFPIQGEAGHWGSNYSGPEVNATLNNALAQLINNVFHNVELMRMLGAG